MKKILLISIFFVFNALNAHTNEVKRILVGNSPCWVLTRLNTRKIAPSAPRNENKETRENPSIEILKLKTIASTAPSAAPLETPSVKGAARSFLKSA